MSEFVGVGGTFPLKLAYLGLFHQYYCLNFDNEQVTKGVVVSSHFFGEWGLLYIYFSLIFQIFQYL